ncbi:MAG TPA: GPW/gp25 family protein [Fimbriimonadaceae bacterium]|nr:GPW/gp25 family protein [Fimbriimonadaceae bacterium]
MDQTKDFLGSGWKFPPRLDSRGRIELVHQEQDVEEAIRMILMTRKGERPMRPEFGCQIHDLVFDPNDAATAGLARRYVQEALMRWEPRIAVLNVTANVDARYPERLLVSIDYTLIATQDRRNLVFPFYVIPGES